MSSSDRPLTLLCIATYFKGVPFLRAAHAAGCRVHLLTRHALQHEAWPRDVLEDVYYLPIENDVWDRAELERAVSYLARTLEIDRIVALDDFDLEKAAALREHLRIPGLSESKTRFFRDKLAMRARAEEAGLPVPAFVHPVNRARIQRYLDAVPAPWVLKPRSQAATLGIKKLHSADELWSTLEALGDEGSYYVLERFVPGDIFHVDSITFDGTVVFARASRYADPPMRVAHEGGVFCTHTLPRDTPEEQALLDLNRQVLGAMGLERGVSHTEFIRAEADGRLYFLETSARVGGAHIVEMVEAASGVNLWAEWARIEALRPGRPYTLPPVRDEHAGLLISLARQEHPDHSVFDDPEVVWRMEKAYHAGVIVRSDDPARVKQLLDRYMERVYRDFHTSRPLGDRASL